MTVCHKFAGHWIWLAPKSCIYLNQTALLYYGVAYLQGNTKHDINYYIGGERE